jgi:hypothetical protein
MVEGGGADGADGFWHASSGGEALARPVPSIKIALLEANRRTLLPRPCTVPSSGVEHRSSAWRSVAQPG